MEQQGTHAAAGSSPSAGHQQQPHIRNSQQSPEPTIGLGLGLDNSASPSANVPQFSTSDFNINNANQFMNTSQAQGFPDGTSFSTSNPDFAQSFDPQGQADFSQSLLASEFNSSSNNGGDDIGGDFSLFPPTTQGDQFNAPLFGETTLNPNEVGDMTTSQAHASPTPPHLLQPEPHQPGSAHQSPSFNQQSFPNAPGGHSRNASLGPEAALMAGQMDWSQQQFQGHRRSPSEFSDVSSAAPSPNLGAQDSFEPLQTERGHSPLQRAQDGFYDGVNNGLGNFSISDQMAARSRSPSHSPAISPRIAPQPLPDMSQGNQNFGLGAHPQGYLSAPTIGYPMPEQFPALSGGEIAQQMSTPMINIDFAPNSRTNSFEPAKPHMDQDSLTPPDRGRPRSRPRAVTDPFNIGGPTISRPSTPGNSHLGADLAGRSGDSSRSLSPAERSTGGGLSPGDRSSSANAAGRRRQSMSAVPNNVIALRLADPEYSASQEQGGNAKRAQKHPATFQCTLCPKRFTRAYNLRSHLRTHTDERPFVCTVCGKAFARQHDRKRHEGLHSGEKKFVCKGDLKAGGQWGCGRRFARADALGRHFRSEAGRICIKPLLDEEMLERQRAWQEQRMQNAMAQNMAAQQASMMAPAYPSMDGGFSLPASLLAQYPALAQMNWQSTDAGGVEDDISGRSSFEASDYDDGDDTGYVSGPGAGYGEGGMQQNFGDMGYNSDYGGR